MNHHISCTCPRSWIAGCHGSLPLMFPETQGCDLTISYVVHAASCMSCRGLLLSSYQARKPIASGCCKDLQSPGKWQLARWFIGRTAGTCFVLTLRIWKGNNMPAATLATIFENGKKIHGKAQKGDMSDVFRCIKHMSGWWFRPWWLYLICLEIIPLCSPHHLGEWLSIEVKPSKQGVTNGPQWTQPNCSYW